MGYRAKMRLTQRIPASIASPHRSLQANLPDDCATWISVGLALRAETGGGANGRAMWDAWSAGSAKYWPGECAARWATFQPSGTNLATGGKIVWLAARRGWRAAPRVQNAGGDTGSGSPSIERC